MNRAVPNSQTTINYQQKKWLKKKVKKIIANEFKATLELIYSDKTSM